MGNRQGVSYSLTCTFCKNQFLAKQANYKTCSVLCRSSLLKEQRKAYYTTNSDDIKARVSKNKKVALSSYTCLVCENLFMARKGTQCCSQSCRKVLNNSRSKQRYSPTLRACVCLICSGSFKSKRAVNYCSSVCYKKHKTRYVRERYKNDIQFKIATNLRSRIKSALRGKTKKEKTISLLGCSLEEFRLYLEARFSDGMSWENYGEWHIDHIVPLSSFDLTDSYQLSVACHYTNLQPLWAKDNYRKGNRVAREGEGAVGINQQ